MGRATLFTKKLAREVCQLVAGGLPIGAACRRQGIGRQTLYDWRAKGRAGVEPYAKFARDLERAQGQAECTVTLQIVQASATDWRAGAWWLERRFPKRWGVRRTMRIEKAAEEMSDEELDEVIARHGYVRVSSDEEPQR